MLSKSAKDLLKENIEAKGRAVVCKELGISSPAISQLLNDNYNASTENMESRIMTMYAADGMVNCPELGLLLPEKCADNHRLAQRKKLTGNPLTARLYLACRSCTVRR